MKEHRPIYPPIFISFLFLFVMQGCSHKTEKVDTSSDKYREAVSAFYVSLAAEQTNHVPYAINHMRKVTKLYPNEPAAWANIGVMALQQGSFKFAKEKLSKAQKQAPKNADIAFLLGLLESRQGNIEHALKHLKKAQKMDPDNVKILYKRAEELERQGMQVHAQKIEKLLQKILRKYPQNQSVLLELGRVAEKNNDKNILMQTLKKLKEHADGWPQDALKQFEKLQEAANTNNKQDIQTALIFFKNTLQQQPEFQQDVAVVQLPENKIGFMIQHFLRLPQPQSEVAPADSNLSFQTSAEHDDFQNVTSVSLRGERTPDLVYLNDEQVSINGRQNLNFPGKQKNKSPHTGIAAIDYNYDFLNDLAFAGQAGFQLYQQNTDSTFTNITAKTGLGSPVTTDSYQGVWAADIDSDGDLDIVLAPMQGSPKILQNNGDNTFKSLHLFDKVNTLKDFSWADLDGDGDPDGIFLEQSGKMIIYLNDRSGHFHQLQASKQFNNIEAIDVSDLDRDGTFDVVVAGDKHTINRFWYDHKQGEWRLKKIVQTSMNMPARLFVDDLDNNGGADILLSSPSGSQVWLNTQDDKYKALSMNIPVFVSSIADISGDKRLDLVGRSTKGDHHAVELVNHGTKDYHAEILRPRASGPLGDRRINSFGIGSEIEARAGLMYQKKMVTSPLVHIGLGSYERAGMVRIIWPNGSVQAAFSGLNDASTLTNKQSLKGSCPWLFAYDGQNMNFVTDFLWSSPLGLRINAQSTAGVIRSSDRIKIRGGQLKPRDGHYDLRITAELWETHFFDKVALMAVDHPAHTRVFMNERFSIPPPGLSIHVTEDPHTVKKVTDGKGHDVTSAVRKRDGRYLANFERTRYQGLAKKHAITINLGNDFPDQSENPLWLLAYGWVRPTDSSINLALSQSSKEKPTGISVQVPDGSGGWITAKKNVGFPAGKHKMVMIKLNNMFKHSGDHRIRLVTSTETYWDQIRWARELPGAHIKQKVMPPEVMKLDYRGYSKVTEADSISPSVPHYHKIAGTSPKWRDLIGFYTRYGDVSELLKKVDDRYVIMNAGDEMRFRFKYPGPTKKGWKRDFVLIGDGWEKDGDLNTKYSKTVLPLPSHQRDAYKYAPSTLKNDPVYQAHKKDWEKYQTRYVMPEIFRKSVVTNGNNSRGL